MSSSKCEHQEQPIPLSTQTYGALLNQVLGSYQSCFGHPLPDAVQCDIRITAVDAYTSSSITQTLVEEYTTGALQLITGQYAGQHDVAQALATLVESVAQAVLAHWSSDVQTFTYAQRTPAQTLDGVAFQADCICNAQNNVPVQGGNATTLAYVFAVYAPPS